MAHYCRTRDHLTDARSSKRPGIVCYSAHVIWTRYSPYKTSLDWEYLEAYHAYRVLSGQMITADRCWGVYFPLFWWDNTAIRLAVFVVDIFLLSTISIRLGTQQISVECCRRQQQQRFGCVYFTRERWMSRTSTRRAIHSPNNGGDHLTTQHTTCREV